ncbi:MAG: rane-flanked domain [Acidimicrobiales bacterium]|nr:rane-flanked domain [Acidimicrobiales bacterium]
MSDPVGTSGSEHRPTPPAPHPSPPPGQRPSEPRSPVPPVPAPPTVDAPKRLHPVSPVLDLIVSARQFAFPVAILAFGSSRSLLFGPLVVVAMAGLVVWKALAWSRFSYRLHDDVLTIESGVFNRTRREVPVSRIQQVDLQRRLRHRVLGVAVVRIDTAGGGSGAEVTLEAIADGEADFLRSALLQRAHAVGAGARTTDVGAEADAGTGSGGPASGIGARPEPVVVASLGTRELVVAGLTGSRLTTGLALAGAAYGLLVELPGNVFDDLGDRLPAGSGAAVLGALVAVPVLLLLAVVSSILTDHGYLLVRVGDDLHLRRGLLDQREATISLHRVQAVRVHENLLRRALGLASVQLQNAGGGTQAEGAVSRLTIPYVRRELVDALFAQVLPAGAHHPDLIAAPAAARRRAWVRHVAPVVLVTAVALAATRSGWALWLLVLVLPAALLAELRYRNLGHAATPAVVVARGGALVRETTVVPVAKAQSTRLRSSPFQRRLHLATLHIDVAGRGGTPTVSDGDASRLAILRHASLHAPAALADEEAVRRRRAATAR